MHHHPAGPHLLNGAETMEDQINHIIGKVLRQFGLEHDRFVSWKGAEV